MGKAFFVKELVSNPLILDGRKIPFEIFGDDAGGIVTEDQGLIDSLRIAERRKTGGVYEVDEEQFNAQKKKASANELQRSSRATANHAGPPKIPPKSQGAVAAASSRLSSQQKTETFRVAIPTTKVPIGAPLEKPDNIPPVPPPSAAPKRPTTRRLSQIAPAPPSQEQGPDAGSVATQ